jgi:hypothetical protein
MHSNWTTLITDQFGGQLAHHVSDAYAANRMHGEALRTICGRFITPAPLSAPEGELCPLCAARLPSYQPSRSTRPRHPADEGTASGCARCSPGDPNARTHRNER